MFNLTSKQLHYILLILGQQGFIKKITNFALNARININSCQYSIKTKSLVEQICDILFENGERVATKQNKKEIELENCCEKRATIKDKLDIGYKFLRRLTVLAEKQCLIEPFQREERRLFVKLNKKYWHTETFSLFRLTKTKFNLMILQRDQRDDNLENSFDISEIGDPSFTIETHTRPVDLKTMIGNDQSIDIPLYSRIFAKLEESGSEGIPIKSFGAIFGFDFYKSRRIISNLQTHSKVVTFINESSDHKSKYQRIVLKKFAENQKSTPNSLNNTVDLTQEIAKVNDKIQINSPKISNAPTILIKKEETEQVAPSTSLNSIKNNNNNNNNKSSEKNIYSNIYNSFQSVKLAKHFSFGGVKSYNAMIMDRTTARRNVIIRYLKLHKIVTKYQINNEIRSIEREEGIKAQIDSKTTIRLLNGLEKEGLLHIFYIYSRGVNFMCLRDSSISETDDFYINYCSTFKRTNSLYDLEKSNTSNRSSSRNKNNIPYNSDIDDDGSRSSASNHSFNLNISNVSTNDIVKGLETRPNYCKYYGSVPRLQKAIVLHRFLQYLLFFYDGKQQAVASSGDDVIPQIDDSFITETYTDEEKRIVNECRLPFLSETYKPLPRRVTTTSGNEGVAWNTFIPPCDNKKSLVNTLSNNGEELLSKNCCFISEVFSHMPISVFCSIIDIHFVIPGLVALLKHPVKRYLLLKDLPHHLVAPLIYDRRYLQKMSRNLHVLTALGLASFVQSPCNSSNRDLDSQMIYLHNKAMFYDTSANNCKTWDQFKQLNLDNISNENNAEMKYEKCYFNFKDNFDDLANYWHKLVHVSMNTYKNNIQTTVHFNLKRRKEFMNQLHVMKKSWQLKSDSADCAIEYGDYLGPGCYDSQLFLHLSTNWTFSSSVKNEGDNRMKSSSKGTSDTNQPAIMKENDASAPFTELAIKFNDAPFSHYRGNTNSASVKRTTKKNSKPKASKLIESASYQQIKRIKTKIRKNKEPLTATLQKAAAIKSFKVHKAKQLLNKARFKSVSKIQIKTTTNNYKKRINSKDKSKMNNFSYIDRRAIWQSDQDQLILLIKVASIYFTPQEKNPPFKVIRDVMHCLMEPSLLSDKKTSSYGRRIKLLLKSNMNRFYVINKLELCSNDAEMKELFGEYIKRNLSEREQVRIYTLFIKKLQSKFLTNDNNKQVNTETPKTSITTKVKLPATMEEFKQKYKVCNSFKNFFGDKLSNFKQPTTDYEITSNTVQSAIHVNMILMNIIIIIKL
jgi:hypothetical protein